MAEERARIARELHDVVAHNISVAVVQAEAAAVVLDDDPAEARAALVAIQTSGRRAPAEVPPLLGGRRRAAGGRGGGRSVGAAGSVEGGTRNQTETLIKGLGGSGSSAVTKETS